MLFDNKMKNYTAQKISIFLQGEARLKNVFIPYLPFGKITSLLHFALALTVTKMSILKN